MHVHYCILSAGRVCVCVCVCMCVCVCVCVGFGYCEAEVGGDRGTRHERADARSDTSMVHRDKVRTCMYKHIVYLHKDEIVYAI